MLCPLFVFVTSLALSDVASSLSDACQSAKVTPPTGSLSFAADGGCHGLSAESTTAGSSRSGAAASILANASSSMIGLGSLRHGPPVERIPLRHGLRARHLAYERRRGVDHDETVHFVGPGPRKERGDHAPVGMGDEHVGAGFARRRSAADGGRRPPGRPDAAGRPGSTGPVHRASRRGGHRRRRG